MGMEQQAYRYPQKAAVVWWLVCVMGAVAGVQGWSAASQVAEASPDRYAAQAALARFQGVKDLIPDGTQVGYFSDLEDGSVRGVTAFIVAQYALAPRLLMTLSPRAQYEWVLGNFSKPMDFAGEGQSRGLTLVQDAGQGVVVYRRAGK